MVRRYNMLAAVLAVLIGGMLAVGCERSRPGTAFTVTLAADTAPVPDDGVSGRLVLFFINERGPAWDATMPIEGPFWEAPQPIASVAVEGLKRGASVTFDEQAVSFPVPLDDLSGWHRVQALLVVNHEARSHQAPGNFCSDAVAVTLQPDASNHVPLTVRHRIEPSSLDSDLPNLHYVDVRSAMLSDFYGRDVYHRAGVALPKAYHASDSDAPGGTQRTHWPAIYVIPGFGGDLTGAEAWARVHMTALPDMFPHAAFIVLDPDSHLGHHGFLDNDNHGPRGTALVREFIPHLEARFRLIAAPDARIVTGHSSGGWSSLWLQLHWPDVFGACWSSAPDPVDFTAFQMTNIYDDHSMFVTADGAATPSYWHTGRDAFPEVLMTVREEVGMEFAIHPLGGSGQQWDTWRAMFSPPDPATSFPHRMFDSRTGEIDRTVAEQWKRFDIARLVQDDWQRFGPIMLDRVRLACGRLDNYYLNRAVERLQAIVDERRDDNEDDHDGYIWMIDHATHGNIDRFTTVRWNDEMRAFLRAGGHHD